MLQGSRQNYRFATNAVHAGADRDATGAIVPPLYFSTNYEHRPDGELLNGFQYTLIDNPMQHRLEEALATLENGGAALAFASGTAAGVAYLQSLSPGTHVIFPDDLFYGFRALSSELLPRWNVDFTVVDMTDLDAVERAMRDNTAVIWVETPSNPLMKVSDIRALAAKAHARNARLLVDSTFPTPALLRPIELGADVVLHSTTKYMGGHSDVQSGALVFASKNADYDAVIHIRKTFGNVASPFSSWLVFRGLRTLELRMKAHSANAMSVARALEAHPRVERVFYPGLESHAGHSIAREQMHDFGGMLSFRVKGGPSSAIGVASGVKLFINAGSLGGPESLIRHVASTTKSSNGVPPDLLRVSVGLEHADDLIEDLEQALASA
ncbi:MAG TPA: aminotransferase class I/II-fold pyridoxal phosphate-dependent enzyme [Candidatus Aquilonibacter sp.]